MTEPTKNPATTGTTATLSHWRVIAAYAGLVAITQLLWVTFTPITTDSAAEWHVSVDAVGWLSLIFPLVYVLLSLPFGIASDRNYRGALTAGAALTVIGAALRVIPGYGCAFAGQWLIATGQPLVLNAVNKLAVLYVAPHRRSIAIAAGTASLFVGILVSNVTSPFIMNWHGLPAVLLIQAAVSVAAAAGMLLALRVAPLYDEAGPANLSVVAQQGGTARVAANEGNESNATIDALGANGNTVGTINRESTLATNENGSPRFAAFQDMAATLRELWSQRWLRLFSLLLFAGFGIFITLATWLEVLAKPIGIDSEQVGIGIGIMTAAGIAGAAVMPGWAMRGGRARSMIVLSLAVSVLLLVGLVTGLAAWAFMSMLALTGFLLLANLPIVLSAAEERVSPRMAGAATGILLLFGNLGGIALSLLVQVLLDYRAAAISALGIVTLAILPFALRFPRSGSQQTRHTKGGVTLDK